MYIATHISTWETRQQRHKRLCRALDTRKAQYVYVGWERPVRYIKTMQALESAHEIWETMYVATGYNKDMRWKLCSDTKETTQVGIQGQ